MHSWFYDSRNHITHCGHAHKSNTIKINATLRFPLQIDKPAVNKRYRSYLDDRMLNVCCFGSVIRWFNYIGLIILQNGRGRTVIKFLSYEQRLKELNAETLELRRLKFDLLQIFKMSRSLIVVDDNTIIFRTDSLTRGDFKVFSAKIMHVHFHLYVYLPSY